MTKNSGDWKGLQGHDDDPAQFKHKAWVHEGGRVAYIYMYIHVCMCLNKCTNKNYVSKYMHMYLYIYIPATCLDLLLLGAPE